MRRQGLDYDVISQNIEGKSRGRRCETIINETKGRMKKGGILEACDHQRHSARRKLSAVGDFLLLLVLVTIVFIYSIHLLLVLVVIYTLE